MATFDEGRRIFLRGAIALGVTAAFLNPKDVLEILAQIPVPKTQVMLTIDDGPYHMPEISNSLPKGNYVTHFVVGRNLPGHEEACIEAIIAGHAIANHTQNHQSFSNTKYSLQQLKEEILAPMEKLGELYAAAGYNDPLLFRFPGGDEGHAYKKVKGVTYEKGSAERKEAIKEFLDSLGYTVVRWHRDTNDWKCYDKKNYNWSPANAVGTLKGTKEGQVILAHDRPVKVSGLVVVQNIIPYLIQHNYRSVAVKQPERREENVVEMLLPTFSQ